MNITMGYRLSPFRFHFCVQVASVLSCFFVIVSTLCLIFSTLPKFQIRSETGEISRKYKKKDGCVSGNIKKEAILSLNEGNAEGFMTLET